MGAQKPKRREQARLFGAEPRKAVSFTMQRNPTLRGVLPEEEEKGNILTDVAFLQPCPLPAGTLSRLHLVSLRVNPAQLGCIPSSGPPTLPAVSITAHLGFIWPGITIWRWDSQPHHLTLARSWAQLRLLLGAGARAQGGCKSRPKTMQRPLLALTQAGT